MTEQTLHTPESIKELLTRNNAAVERALVVLYERQTADEQTAETTKYQNGVGFNAVDAEILSSFATWVERKQRMGIPLGKCLTEKQMAVARKRVVRYVRQLAEVANEKAGISSTKKVVKTMAECENLEQEMWRMEAQGEREEALREAKAELALEEKRTTAYYNGRRTVDIQREKVETLEQEVKHHSLETLQADPEAREFRAARSRITDWLNR